LGSVLKITEEAEKFWLLFFQNCVNFSKYGVGYILGDFFTNSSGHPGQVTFSAFVLRNLQPS
jgi:hypothetical protein